MLFKMTIHRAIVVFILCLSVGFLYAHLMIPAKFKGGVIRKVEESYAFMQSQCIDFNTQFQKLEKKNKEEHERLFELYEKILTNYPEIRKVEDSFQ